MDIFQHNVAVLRSLRLRSEGKLWQRQHGLYLWHHFHDDGEIFHEFHHGL